MELHHLEERRRVHHHFYYRSRWIQIFTYISVHITIDIHSISGLWKTRQLCKPSFLHWFTGFSTRSTGGAGGCGVPDLLRRKLCCLAVSKRRDEGGHEAAGQKAEDRWRKKDLCIWGPGAWSGFFPWILWDFVEVFCESWKRVVDKWIQQRVGKGSLHIFIACKRDTSRVCIRMHIYRIYHIPSGKLTCPWKIAIWTGTSSIHSSFSMALLV